jgi:hypothetical protein
MTTLTLLTRIYNSHQLKQIDIILSDLFGDLSVEAAVTGTQAGRWVQLEVSGEDESIATKLLEREAGFCPINLEYVKKFSTIKGYVTSLDRSTEELFVDIGVFQPKNVPAVIPIAHLQTHLAGKKKTSLKKIIELWGLCENLPLEIKVLEVKAEENRVEAELQSGQIHKFAQWKESLLDRLLVIGASTYEVKTAVEQEGLDRDVIEVESLGMFEHALVCKLGTDAAGLIGRIGRRLRKAKFTVFNPKNARAFLDPT